MEKPVLFHPVSFHGRREIVTRGERGSMLIIAVGVLTLLAVLGTTFVSLMKLERQATRNYIDGQVVELINDSALERVISDLRDVTNYFSYTSVRSPWLYEFRDRKGRPIYGELAHGRAGIEDSRVGRWEILADDVKKVHRYKTKVIDCAAQININGRQDSLARMLENLAEAVTRSPWLNKGNQYPFYTGWPQKGQKLTGVQILEFRNKLEGHRFRTKTQLRDIIGRENYETIKDFITVHSWVDPYTYKPDDGLDEVDIFQSGRSGGGRVLGGGNRVGTHDPVQSPSPRMSAEQRSPININTAPEEVLVACLMGLGGRRPFPYARLAYTGIDEGAAILGQKVIGQEERDNLLPRGVWVFMRALEYDQAVRIARRIIEQRKNPARQFRTWSTGTAGQPGGFAEFINDLDDTFFPTPATARVIDPANPDDRRVQQEIIRGGNEIHNMWQRGHEVRERSFRKQFGMPYHRQFAFYFDLVKSAIISNFNPNSRISRFNPNVPAFVPVDKSDLVTLDRQDFRTPRKGYTTEFCFDSMGIYEVTTLGEIAQRLGSGSLTSVGGAQDQFDTIYRRKVRSVVKVHDVIRHTSQFHFERTFQSGSFSSRNNRKYVVTWPDPMEALTDAVSAGSKRDGRVELAGLKDGTRLEIKNISSRLQTYRTPEVITMAWGGLDREQISYQQLRNLVRTGQIGSKAFVDRLADVFDANYSRVSPILRKFYRKEEVIALGGAGSGLNLDPVADTDVLGSDLMPDGFHTSLFKTGHLGGRYLLFPSHTRTGQGSGKSGPGATVGAGFRQNITGNVPYYQGGIAFWVKFEFDGVDPVFSGLVGCTSVIEDVGMAVPKDSEGTQFYIFKNTKGQLRVVRMYYHQAFLDLGGGEDAGGGEQTGLNLVPPVEVDEDGQAEEEDILDLDPRKPIARSDVIIDISHFKAHEWHHIAVDYNDESPSASIQVWIDFEKIQGGGPFIPQEEISAEPTAWVRLNCRRPRDGLFVGGFIRPQGVSDAGVFKWFTNSLGGGDTSVRGLRIVEPSLKRILANATIDEVVCYDGTFPGVRNYFAPRGAPGYFTNQTGEYANLMEVPMPPDVDNVVLRSFDWTSYYPTFFTGNNRAPQQLLVRPIECQVTIKGPSSPGRFQEPWRNPSITNRVAGRPAFRAQAQGLAGRNADIIYRFFLPPAKAQSGSLAGGSVQTPVIDDVTLTYFLADPKILHQEEVDY